MAGQGKTGGPVAARPQYDGLPQCHWVSGIWFDQLAPRHNRSNGVPTPRPTGAKTVSTQ